MAESSTSFSIDLAVKSEGVKSAADLLDVYAQRLAKASQATTETSAAVQSAEASYRQAEASVDRAAKAVERIGVAAEAQRGKMKAAMEAGDERAFWRAATAAEALQKKQAEATTKAEGLKAALAGQAEALDKARAAATQAVAAEERLVKVEDAAKKAVAAQAQAQAEAAKIAAGSGKSSEAAESLSKLGGPLGAVGQKIFGVRAGYDKLKSTFGDKAPYIAATVGLAAIAAAVLAVAAAAAYGLIKVTVWAVGLADKTHQVDALQKRLGENIAKTFGGLKIDGLLKQLGTLVDLFDSSNASGRAMKVVFESLFQPLVDGAAGFVPVLRHAFLEMEILVLRALIAVKPFGSKIAEAGKLIAEGVGLAAVVVGALVVGLIGLVIGAYAVVNAITKVIVLIGGGLVNAFQTARAWLSNFSLADVGVQMIKGLAEGVTAGTSAVVDAVKNAASKAVGAAKSALGIASPSRVFKAEVGAHISGGIAEGVRANGDAVGDAVAEVSAPGGAAGVGGVASGQAPAASTSTTYQITITADSGGAKDIADALRQVLLDVTQGAAVQVGAGVPA